MTAGIQQIPDIGMDGAGNFVIAWQSVNVDGSQQAIVMQRYNSSAVVQGTNTTVNTTTAGTQVDARIARASGGDFIVSWDGEETDNDGNGRDVFYKKYNSAGTVLIGETLVNVGGVLDDQTQTLSAPAINTAGDFVIAWQDQTGSGPGDIKLRRFGEDADVDFTAASSNASEASNASIGLTRAGAAYVLANVANVVTVSNAGGGTATAGTDFTTVFPTTVTFPADSSTSQNLTITINNDNTFEANETINLSLGTVTNGTAVGQTTHTYTINNDDTAPSISVNSPSVTEGDSGTTTLTFTISLSAVSGVNAVGNYATANVSATAGADYVAIASTPFTIAAGATSTTVSVTVNGDTLLEGNETFSLNLSSVTGTTNATASGTGTITDDDAPASITVSSGNNQSTGVSTNFASPLVALVKNANGNAVQSVIVTFTAPASGASSVFSTSTNTINVVTNASGLASSGTFAANATAGTNYTVTAAAIGGSSPSVNFTLSNTAPPVINVGNASLTEGDSGTANLTFNVTLTSPSASTVTVNYSTANGTAIAGTDYTAVSGVVTFTPGVTSQPINVPILGNTIFQANRQFTVTLSSPSGGGSSLGTSTGTATINDDDAPTSIAVSSGNNQSANTGSNFASPLVALVKNAAGNAVQGVSVTYTAPAAGASSVFSTTTNTITVTSNASGLASSGTFAANGTAGANYNVTAAAIGGTNPSTNFTLSNTVSPTATPTVAAPGGAITVNANNFSITGTAAADSLVQVYTDINNNGMIDGADAVVASQQLAGGATSYSVPTSLTQNAANNFLVTATAPPLTESAAVDVPTITEDSMAPALPVVTSPASATTVNAITFTITGTAEADAFVGVYADANNDGAADTPGTPLASQQLNGGATTFTISTPLTQDAANNFVVTATDQAGNESSAADVPTITEDSMAPAAPTVTSPAAPTTVNAANFSITGTAEAGALVRVFLDANNDGVADTPGTPLAMQQLGAAATAFSISVSLTQDTANNFVVTATDAVGNVSSAADVPTITEDSMAPALPLVTSPAAPTTVNAANFSIIGTAEANALVKVFLDANNDGVADSPGTPLAMQQLAGGSTGFSISVTLTQDAANNFVVTATDAAFNQSAAADVPPITEDSTAPALPVVTSPAAATTVNANTFAITGTAEANALVKVFLDANNDGVADSPGTPLAMQQLAGGATAFSISVTLAQDAANNFVVTATDAFANQSAPADVPTITEDSTAPALPVVTGPAAPTTVNAATFNIAGTAEANSLVKVYRDVNNNGAIDGGDTVVNQQQLAGGATAFMISTPLLQDAANTFVVTATDAVGNVSSAADVPTITEDSMAPAAPTVTSPAAPTTVNASAFAVQGVAEANSLVSVYNDVNNNGAIDGGDTVVGQQQLTGGVTTFSISVALSQDAANNFVVTATDAAFNQSAAADVPTITEDSIAPAAPVVTSPAAPANANGFSFAIAGTAEAGSLVKVYRDANNNGMIDAGDAVVGSQQLAAGATGFSITVPLAPGGGNDFVVTATDAAGNESAAADVPSLTGITLSGAVAGPGGLVYALNSDLTVRFVRSGGYPGYTGPVRVAVGDVNNDGTLDVVTATATGRGYVRVFSGVDGSELGSFRMFAGFGDGLYVAVGDIDGDHYADILVGAASGSSQVAGYSGRTGACWAAPPLTAAPPPG